MSGAGPVEASGRFVIDDEAEWYRIDDVDQLDPFLVSVVAPDDQWIFVSTSGALTAGRGSADRALFPYETDDRLHRAGGLTGPVTVLRVGGADRPWEPFAPWAVLGDRRRSVAKSAAGDRLRFEEHDPELGLTFRATWSSAGELGLVRRCELTVDEGRGPIEVGVVDGLLDVLPAGVELAAQQTSSTLVDAYRRSELDQETGLALFTLEARISDQADPAEALTANVVWADGLAGATIALSDRQLPAVRAGAALEAEHLVTGRKGAFLQGATVTVEPGRARRWLLATDVDRDHLAVAALRRRLLDRQGIGDTVDAAVDRATAELTAIVAAADGLQETADRRATVHHFANTLFNGMRGGVFLDDHRVDVADVVDAVGARNRPAGRRLAAIAADLDPVVEIDGLRAAVADDPDLVRLVAEYLPVSFSRRHGDPSRPWNRFSIPAPDPDGRPARGYEGNWRDIFQNWEALVHSFPGYIESVVAKFLNASTLDGHNPYRITDRGLDWERPEDGSWGNFGYWGDHQIVYLHRLLLAAERFHPGLLVSRLDARVFSSGDVPYRIVPYEELVADPKRTLVFDEGLQSEIDRRVAELGADGRLVPAPARALADDGFDAVVHHTTLAEKLLVPALAKLSNLVAGAGIWMNTQRPEWNDANNALVGNGVSTVTLIHLRDYLLLVDDLLGRAETTIRVSGPVLAWLTELAEAFEDHRDRPESDSAIERRRRDLLDRIGLAFERYRAVLYAEGPGPLEVVEADRLRSLLAATRPHLAEAVDAAERPDGLFHAYWLLHLEPGRALVEPLPEMLEGQAAVLDSSTTGPETARALVDRLFTSELHRPDQGSFVLYPNRPPPRFLDKNRVDDDLLGPATRRLLARAEAGAGLGRDGAVGEVIARGVDGVVRFGPDLHSGRHLVAALDRFVGDPEVDEARSELVATYEEVFGHRAFTGRSQSMYRYEGLGSIYWHMVSKVLFGLQERLIEAIDAEADPTLVADLAAGYRRVRSGLGFMKSAPEQGSFPTDPHSHTPAHAGAQQPGMTGQVKEGVLIRWGELGVRVDGGRVAFRPVLLDRSEFLGEARPWAPLGVEGSLDAATLGFTYCGVPVVYRLLDDRIGTGGEAGIRVTRADGTVAVLAGSRLDGALSRELFARTGGLRRIDVDVPGAQLLDR